MITGAERRGRPDEDRRIRILNETKGAAVAAADTTGFYRWYRRARLIIIKKKEKRGTIDPTEYRQTKHFQNFFRPLYQRQIVGKRKHHCRR